MSVWSGRKRDLAALLLAGGFLAGLLTGCGEGGQATPALAEERVQRLVPVEVEAVAAVAFTDALRIVGTVAAQRDVRVAAEESGVIRALLVERGQRVAAGQPLARIDDKMLQAQHEQARAEATLARETWERQRRLWEEEGIGSELAYLQAKHRAETAAANLKMFTERVGRTVVRAPIAGLVEERLVEVGTMVAPGTLVARIVAADTVKVTGGIPERYAGEIRRGAALDVDFDVLGGRTFTGELAFVGSSVNEQNRTFPIEVAVPNPGGVIKPGMVASVRVARRAVQDALVVPREAVLRTEAGFIVYVVDERGGAPVAEARPVVTGPAMGGRVLVESGLEAGERIVVVGQQRIAPGDALQIVSRAVVTP
jgi:membrane fusion protein, multidrug efflux system